MATPEQEQEARTQLDAALTQLAQITPDSLARSDLGVELNFSKGLPYFERTLKLFRDLKNASMDGASYTAMSQLAAIASQALTQFKAIQTFSVAQNPQNTMQVRDNLIAQVRESYDGLYQQIKPHIAYSVRKGTDCEALGREALRALEEIRAAQAEQLQVQKAFSD